MDEVIKLEDLKNPKSNIVKMIIYLYSMETFIYYGINEASVNKDKTKKLTLGPFACVLREIVSWAEDKRNKELGYLN